jgi:hypothetical protein
MRILFILPSCCIKINQINPMGFIGNGCAHSARGGFYRAHRLQSLAAEAVTFGLTAAGRVGAGNIDMVCHTGLRLVVRTLLHAAGYRRFGVAIAFLFFHDFYPPFL